MITGTPRRGKCNTTRSEKGNSLFDTLRPQVWGKFEFLGAVLIYIIGVVMARVMQLSHGLHVITCGENEGQQYTIHTNVLSVNFKRASLLLPDPVSDLENTLGTDALLVSIPAALDLVLP